MGCCLFSASHVLKTKHNQLAYRFSNSLWDYTHVWLVIYDYEI